MKIPHALLVERRARYLALREGGLPVLAAAQAVGITRRTAYSYEVPGLPGRNRRAADVEPQALACLAADPGRLHTAYGLAALIGDPGAQYVLACHLPRLARAGRVVAVETLRRDGSVRVRRYRIAEQAADLGVARPTEGGPQ